MTRRRRQSSPRPANPHFASHQAASEARPKRSEDELWQASGEMRPGAYFLYVRTE